MSQHYSDPNRATDPYALPDVEVFQLTAAEIAGSHLYEDEQYEAMKRPAFRLATMNGRVRDQLIDYLIVTHGIEAGWFYQSCLPGCLPDGDMIGPFPSRAAALEDMREHWTPEGEE